MNPEVVTVKNGYSRNLRDTVVLRALTIDEVLKLQRGWVVWFIARDGYARRIKINGRVKTWKRRPDIVIPVKYGMWECGTFEWNGVEWRDQRPYEEVIP